MKFLILLLLCVSSAHAESYTELKAIIARKSLSWQYEETAAKYDVFAIDGILRYDADVWKAGFEPAGIDTTTNSSALSDFEANYKTTANYAVGIAQPPFAVGTTLFAGNCSSGTVTKGTSQAFDFYVDSTTYPNGAYSNGFILIAGNAIVGDYFKLQAVDVSGALTGKAGLILGNPVIRWMVNPNAAIDVSTTYAKLFPAGVTLRLTYYSTAGVLGSDVTVGMNYRLHKP